jgi:hypothetical protein
MHKPFISLRQPRTVNRSDLPAHLAEFYSKHDVNPEFQSLYIVPYSLDEIVRVNLHDIGFQVNLLSDDLQAEWSKFSGFVIARDTFGEEIVDVTFAPSCEAGAIMVLGGDVSGPGGVGPHAWDATLVLARSFDSWLAHLERWQGIDYGIIPGAIKDLPVTDQEELSKHFLELNPQITWARKQ